jgi:uncharacterized protein YkwD
LRSGGIDKKKVMKNVLWLLSLLFVTSSVKGDERLFQKIQRKIQRNPEKGLEYAQKLRAQKSIQPDPYYFLAEHYLNQYHNETKPQKKYSVLIRATTDASKMKKYLSGHNYLVERGDSLFSKLGELLRIQRDTFLKYKDYDKSELMALRYSKLTGKSLPTLEQLDSVVKAKEKQESLLLQVSRMIDGKYFGMPIGDEDIEPYSHSEEREMIRLINKEREKLGLNPLNWDFNLARAARYHANDMASQRYFSHDTYDVIDGKLVKIGGAFVRIRKFYTINFVNSENIAAGNGPAKDAYHQWYTSKGHYENMFNKSSKYVGVGVVYDADSPYKYYWVFCTAR